MTAAQASSGGAIDGGEPTLAPVLQGPRMPVAGQVGDLACALPPGFVISAQRPIISSQSCWFLMVYASLLRLICA
jgi:hypothetical protein